MNDFEKYLPRRVKEAAEIEAKYDPEHRSVSWWYVKIASDTATKAEMEDERDEQFFG